MLRSGPAAAAIAALLCAAALRAADGGRDFSGTWVLDAPAAGAGAVRPIPQARIAVHQTETVLECTAADLKWSYALDSRDTTAQFGALTWSSVAEWDGNVLAISSLVSGPEHYSVMDRWELSSRTPGLLVITRQVIRGSEKVEGQFFYRREEAGATVESSGLARRPEPPPDAEFVVPAGTRVLLELVNQVDTHHSQTGDRVYLRTAFPVYASNRLIVPQGATVLGTVTDVKKPGKVQGRGELYIRFTSLTLPNGVTRDFRSRLGSASGAQGTVDSEEGRIISPSGAAEEARGAMEGGEMGTQAGGMIGLMSGHPVAGSAIGGAAGAAAGVAVVLAKGRPDAVLPKGCNVEMILDRDLHYRVDELR